MDVDLMEVKLAVAEAACGINSLSEHELLERLEDLFWKGFKAGVGYGKEAPGSAVVDQGISRMH